MTVDPYYFLKVLSEEAPCNAIVVADTGANATWTFQGFRIREGWVEYPLPPRKEKEPEVLDRTE